MLRLLVLFFFLFPLSAAAAAAAAPTPFIRMGVNIKASPKLLGHAEKILMEALESVREFPDTVSPTEYRRVLSRLHAQHPYGGSVSVKRIGQELHVTHVMVVSVASRPGDRKRQLFADTSVFDVPNDLLIFRQRYFLPEGTLTESTARFIVARLQTLLTSPKAPQAQPPSEVSSTPATELSSHEIDTGHQEQHPQLDVPPEEPVPQESEAPSANGNLWADRTHYSAGVAVSARKARLSSNGTPVALCYCNNGGFGSLMVGLAAGGGLYFNPDITNFGLDVDALVEFAQTQVLNNGQATPISSIFWHLMGAGVYRIYLPAQIELHLRAGYSYTSFPLAVGVFPGLSYGTPLAGLAVALALWQDILTLTVHADYLALVQTNNAMVFGRPSIGQGAHVDGGIRAQIGLLELTARIAWDMTAVTFTGTTTLNLPSNYTNVTLVDQHVEGSLTLGSRF